MKAIIKKHSKEWWDYVSDNARYCKYYRCTAYPAGKCKHPSAVGACMRGCKNFVHRKQIKKLEQ
jgi:hypothetical protein